jgi:hypothetical protein
VEGCEFFLSFFAHLKSGDSRVDNFLIKSQMEEFPTFEDITNNNDDRRKNVKEHWSCREFQSSGESNSRNSSNIIKVLSRMFV